MPRDSSMEYSGIEQNVVLVGASSQEVLGSFNQSTSEEPSEVIEQERLVYAETTTLNENVLRVKADTVVLSQYEAYYQSSPHLVRQKTGEKVPVVSARFSLGKDRSMVNYAVPDNGAISRCHAEILTREGARGKMYLILDEKSTNHTYVNDQMLNKGVACEIKHGTQIKLADEAFVFYER